MKHLLILIITPIIFSWHCYAQTSHSQLPFTADAFVTKPLHGSNDFFNSTIIANDNSRSMATSYIRVMQSFDFHFENATNQSWSRHKKNFIVHFTIDGKKTNAVFNKKGKLLYSLSNCSEKDLPDASRTLINTTYGDYKIFCVTEACYRGENRLVVVLEDEKSIVYLLWKNGKLQEPMKCEKVINESED